MKVPVSFLSLGPGDPELLTLKVIKTLRESDIVVVPSTAGRSRAAEIIREWCNEDKMRHYELPMQKDRTEVRKVYDDICQQVVAWYNEGQHIAIVVEGDVSIYASIHYVLDELKNAKIPVKQVAGIPSFIAAVAMGAEIIEKHFTLDRTMKGPDHLASLDPQELKQMVDSIRNIEQALGDGIKRPNASEIINSEVVLKRIIAKRPIKVGDILNENNLALLRNSSGVPAKFWDLIAGKQATRDYQINEPILL
jgi:hypothetical protein